VLILTIVPRPETEAYTSHLAELLIDGSLDGQLSLTSEVIVPGLGEGNTLTSGDGKELRILDVCSGSGCISLLLHYLLTKSAKFPKVKTLGLDISPKAVALANENLALNIKKGHLPPLPNGHRQHEQPKHALQGEISGNIRESQFKGHESGDKFLRYTSKKNIKRALVLGTDLIAPIQFREHDIFTSPLRPLGDFDIIISNPPYISRSSFLSTTSYSVQKYEPHLALVPKANSYPREPKSRIQRHLELVGEKKGNEELAQEADTFERKNWQEGDAELTQEADIFYRQLLQIYDWGSTRILVMEVGDREQAIRVVKLAVLEKHIAKTNKFEIWRDYPGQEAQPGEEQEVSIEGRIIPVKGAGKIRSVVLFRVEQVKAAISEEVDAGNKKRYKGLPEI
jgi:methylase of polypeptide subunit release factors